MKELLAKLDGLKTVPRPWAWNASIDALLCLARAQAECLEAMSRGTELSGKWEAVEQARDHFLKVALSDQWPG